MRNKEEKIMFKNKSEAHERVLNAVEDIGHCCAVSEDFRQWNDIAASSIQSFLEDLSAEQLDDTCGAFREYVDECTDKNFADGIKDGLRICLEEMLDYIGDVPEGDEDDYYADYNRRKAELADSIKENIEELKTFDI